MSKLDAETRPLAEVAIGAMTDMQGLLRHAVNVMTFDTTALSQTAREAAWLLMLAWALMIIGGTVVCLAVVSGLVLLLPALPLWVSAGAVGALVLGLGLWLFSKASSKIASIQPIIDVSNVRANEAGHMAEKVHEALESTKDAIHRTADSVHATVDSIKKATDLPYQVEQHPWTMIAGAAGLGFVGGSFLHATTRQVSRASSVHGTNGTTEQQRSSMNGVPHGEPSLLGKLGVALAPQAELLREMALGALFGMVQSFAQDLLAEPQRKPEAQRPDDANGKS